MDELVSNSGPGPCTVVDAKKSKHNRELKFRPVDVRNEAGTLKAQLNYLQRDRNKTRLQLEGVSL